MIRKFLFNSNSLPTKKTSYIMIAFAAMLYSTAINMFYQPSGIFSAGIGSVVGLITFSYDKLVPFFSIIYLVLNIPIIIFFWKKVKRSFIYRTLFFLIVQGAFGFIFMIPAVSNVSQNILGTGFDIQAHKWPIFILPLGGSVLVGLSIATAYKYGASSGGTDIIVYYYSTKKKIAIGRLALMISLGLIMFSFSTTIAIDSTKRENWYITILTTLLAVAISSMIIDIVYPKYSKRRLEIHSSKPALIKKQLDKITSHSHYSSTITSGYTGKKRQVIHTTVLLLEIKRIRRELIKVDPKIWISDSRVERVFGKFNSDAVE